MALFGSASGDVGQCRSGGLRGGNAFLGGYAAYRNARVSRGERWGRTVSIAWPLWRDGGMQLAEAASRLHVRPACRWRRRMECRRSTGHLLQMQTRSSVPSGQQGALRALLAPADGAPVPQPRPPQPAGVGSSRKS